MLNNVKRVVRNPKFTQPVKLIQSYNGKQHEYNLNVVIQPYKGHNTERGQAGIENNISYVMHLQNDIDVKPIRTGKYHTDPDRVMYNNQEFIVHKTMDYAIGGFQKLMLESPKDPISNPVNADQKPDIPTATKRDFFGDVS